MVKLGASSWSYHRKFKEGAMSQESWLEECHRLGLDGLELLDIHFPSTERSYLRKIKSHCVRKGLTISCVSVSNDFGIPKEQLREQVDLTQSWIRIAEFFGAPVMRVFAGWRRPGEDYASSWARMISCMRQVTDYAEDHCIVLGLENHDGNSFMTTPDEVTRIIEDVGSDYLRLNLDTGAYPNPLDDLNRSVKLAVHVHAKIFRADKLRLEPDHSKILPILEDAGYNGFLSIEYEGDADEVKAVEDTVRHLRRLMRT
jgi:sugar phosphate isomerase/epimerase